MKAEVGGLGLHCPRCREPLEERRSSGEELACDGCGATYPVVAGIPDLRIFPDPYISIEEDRAKGRRLARELAGMSFEELVSYYYRHTPAVPAEDARRYARGLLAAEERAEASLARWQGDAPAGTTKGRTFLDLGCGTAPLMTAVGRAGERAIGVDIAFRWLVVAKKRLSEAGLDLPLVCACAEALPFADGTFDRVGSESAIEHFRDQDRALREVRRVLRAGGEFFAYTPNRLSPGPDPQTGIWGGSVLPDRLVAWLVERKGGIAPRRRLHTVRSLRRLVRRAGLSLRSMDLPRFTPGQREGRGLAVRVAVALYELVRRFGPGAAILRWLGPGFHVSAVKEPSE